MGFTREEMALEDYLDECYRNIGFR
jgi:hypothetical protein